MAAPHARAEGASAAAQAAFEEGRRLADARDYAGAVARFEVSERLDPALGTILNLAACYERAGRLASSWRAFDRGATEARAVGEEKRALRARSLADALEPRLSTLAIVLPPNAPADALLRVDGAVVDRASWGRPEPVDGGVHHVQLRAARYLDWEGDTSVGTERDHATLSIPALVEAPSTPPAPATTVESASLTVPVAPPEVPATGTSWGPWRIAGAAGAGVGLVGLGVSAVFGLQARARWNDRQAQCVYDRCSPDGYALGSEAKDAAIRANWTVAISTAVLVGSAVLYFVAPNRKAQVLSVAASPTRGGAELLMVHSF
jgi:hypothetical protein